MSSGYQSGGTDLDSLFLINNSGSSISAGYKVNGSGSYDRYVSIGPTPKRGDVGYKISGSDISNTFMDINAKPLSNSIDSYAYNSNSTVTVTSTVDLYNDGTYDSSSPSSGRWINTGFTPSNYEVYVSLSSGNTPTGSALNSWLNLGTTRSWTLSVKGGVKACTLNAQVRLASNTSVNSSFTISIEAGSGTLP
jgi:hypothetical protein